MTGSPVAVSDTEPASTLRAEAAGAAMVRERSVIIIDADNFIYSIGLALSSPQKYAAIAA